MTAQPATDESTMRTAAKVAADQLGPLTAEQRTALRELLIPVRPARRKAA